MGNDYYSNINIDLLDRIPLTAQRVLEIGCGTGQLGRAFKLRQPMVKYFGVELQEEAAAQADVILDGLLCCNIEKDIFAPKKLCASYDTLVFGDVLEHLENPWRVLADLRLQVDPDGVCVACIPNVSHWSLIEQLLKGRFDYSDHGLLDRTHIRFFTLETAVEMFQAAGWNVVDVSPRNLWPEKTEQALKNLLPLASALNIPEYKLRQDLSALQWVIRAVNGNTPNSLQIAALGLPKIAGVTEARVDYPLKSLKSLPATRAVWGYGSVTIPKDFSPGIMMLQRQFMNSNTFNEKMEALAQDGWVLVADIDDDPDHWKEYLENNYYAFRAVHAVTVSTQYLADKIRHWNPNVRVFQNGIFSLAKDGISIFRGKPKSGRKFRIFFGALNRKSDWLKIMDGILKAIESISEIAEFVVVHDKEFFDTLPSTINKSFHPTLQHSEYNNVLSGCDIALLPLNDTPLNHCKSDLKLIECAANKVAVVCSEIVYGNNPDCRNFVTFAQTADQWANALIDYCMTEGKIYQNADLSYQYVISHRMHAGQVDDRRNYYLNLMKIKGPLEKQRQIRIDN